LLRAMITEMTDRGEKVVLVYPIPEAPWNVPKQVAREEFYADGDENDLTISRAAFETRTEQVRKIFDQIGYVPQLLRFNPEDVLCPSLLLGDCLSVDNGRPLYFDARHLSGHGSQKVAKALVGAMHRAGWLETTAQR